MCNRRSRPPHSSLTALAVCLLALLLGGLILPGRVLPRAEMAAAPLAPGGLATTTILIASADARVSSAAPQQTYGHEITLKIGYSATGLDLSLLRFDIESLPAGTQISSAILRVLVGDKTGEPGRVPVTVRRLTSTWDEGSVNWDTKPSVAAAALATKASGGHEWVTWDLTAQTRDWHSGHSNFGIEMGGPGSATYALYGFSRESASPPELVVVHQPAASATPSATASRRPTLTSTPTPTGRRPTHTPTSTSSRVPDLGDAPDSSNSAGVAMAAYPGVQARFPTVFGPGSPPYGPLHHNQSPLFFLGTAISAEDEADGGFDADGISNIGPPAGVANRDGGDDGLVLPASFAHCQTTELHYAVTVLPGAPSSATVNIWLDWNRSGSWGEVMQCGGQDVPEWAVRNQSVALPGPGTYTFSAPSFRAFNPDPTRDLWIRITIAEKQGSAADGSGIPAGYNLGETEDYLLPGLVPSTGTPTATRSPTPTPTCTPTEPVTVITPVPTRTPTPTQPPIIITPAPTRTPTEPPIIITPAPTRTPTPSHYHDLVAVDIEVSQGIQNLDNDMPLVQDRRTIVRLYPSREDSWLPTISNVNARLFGTRGGSDLPGSPLEANNPITVQWGTASRQHLSRSWWFYLPSDWRSGTITLRAEINHDDHIAEQDKSDNEISIAVTFHQAETFNVVVVPMHLHPDGDRGEDPIIWWGTESDRWDIYNNVLRLHPIADIDVWRFTSTTKPDWHWAGDEWDLREDNAKTRMLTKIASKNSWTSDWVDDLHYMGTVDPDIDTSGTGGIARTSSLNCWVKMGNSHSSYPDWYISGGQTMAHELGHTEGRLHANCRGDEEDGGALDPDYPWPFPDCHLAEVDERGYYGLDVYYGKWGLDEPAVLDNLDDAYPLMGYQRPRWIDPYTYCALLNRYGVNCNLSFSAAGTAADRSAPDLPPAVPERLQALQDATDLVTVMGILHGDEGSGQIKEVAVQPAGQVFADNLAQAEQRLRSLAAGEIGKFSLQVLNGAGFPLYTQPVQEDRVIDVPGNLAGFQELLPWSDAAAGVALTVDEVVLDARIASLHPPTVTLLAPNGGEQLSPHPTISWQAADADGDELDFHILYSPDSGGIWQAVALHVTGSQYQVASPDRLSGSDQALIRVVASDGFHTAHDDSDDTFSVPGAYPQVVIHRPPDTRHYPGNRPIILDGSGDDLEDGVLSDAALVWRSDVDGFLGSGEEVYLPPRRLSPGPHRIVLVASDSDGMTAQAAVDITVGPLRFYLPMLSR